MSGSGTEHGPGTPTDRPVGAVSRSTTCGSRVDHVMIRVSGSRSILVSAIACAPIAGGGQRRCRCSPGGAASPFKIVPQRQKSKQICRSQHTTARGTGHQCRNGYTRRVRARENGSKSGKPIGRARIDATTEAAIRAALASGKGVLKTAREFKTGTSVVQRIKSEMARANDAIRGTASTS